MNHVNVALWARLYRLLADREEYLQLRGERRFDRTSPSEAPSLSVVDAELVANATEIDRLCGAAVRLLRMGMSAGVVEILGWLEPERLAAVALALPEKRREAVLRKGYDWVVAVHEVDEDAIREVNEYVDDLDDFDRDLDTAIRRNLGEDKRREIERRELGVRKLFAGLPHGLSFEDLVTLTEAYFKQRPELLESPSPELAAAIAELEAFEE